jgi:threonine synthase
VKALFADEVLRDELALGAMNSINWGRVLSQIRTTSRAAGSSRPATSSCPRATSATSSPVGTRGGWGPTIGRLVVASNTNDILARWVERGDLIAEPVVPTLSPSMDIQISSNHERLLFELLGRDGPATAELLQRFRDLGAVEAPRAEGFLAARASDAETVGEIGRTAPNAATWPTPTPRSVCTRRGCSGSAPTGRSSAWRRPTLR